MEAVKEKIWKTDYGSHLQNIGLPIPLSFKGSKAVSPVFTEKRHGAFLLC